MGIQEARLEPLSDESEEELPESRCGAAEGQKESWSRREKQLKVKRKQEADSGSGLLDVINN